jgi:hypothetical protein
MSVLATGPTTPVPYKALPTMAAYLRVAAMSVAAYEYAASCATLPFIKAHSRPVFSLPSLQNIACIHPLIVGGKGVDTNSRRYSPDRSALDSIGLVPFVLIRHDF